ncbi:hypothetical protein DFH27DRAFT_64603 [Peziza echinospora]|nr:hypothetical protein DFH27DRAFT_64603 [Peziza echinospora]
MAVIDALVAKKEMIDDRVPLHLTAAGEVVEQEIRRLQEKHTRELEDFKQPMQEKLNKKDQQFTEAFAKQAARIDIEIEKLREAERSLKDSHEKEQNLLKAKFNEMRLEPEERIKAKNKIAQDEKRGMEQRHQEMRLAMENAIEDERAKNVSSNPRNRAAYNTRWNHNRNTSYSNEQARIYFVTAKVEQEKAAWEASHRAKHESFLSERQVIEERLAEFSPPWSFFKPWT